MGCRGSALYSKLNSGDRQPIISRKMPCTRSSDNRRGSLQPQIPPVGNRYLWSTKRASVLEYGNGRVHGKTQRSGC